MSFRQWEWALYYEASPEVREVCFMWNMTLRDFKALSDLEREILLAYRRIQASRSDDPDSETYHDNMPGMTLDEFQAWSHQVIRESQDSGE